MDTEAQAKKPKLVISERKESFRVCLKVPDKKDEQNRKFYESLPPSNRRILWVEHLLGKDGRYLGRPKNDGGWYQVPLVKQGSFLANPYHVKSYGLEESLKMYSRYINQRVKEDCSIEDLCKLLPENEAKLARQHFITHIGQGKGKSTRHYEFNIRGRDFVKKIVELDGKRLACFCELDSPCHVDIVLDLIAHLKGVKTE